MFYVDFIILLLYLAHSSLSFIILSVSLFGFIHYFIYSVHLFLLKYYKATRLIIFIYIK